MPSLLRAALFAASAALLAACTTADASKVRTVNYGYPYSPYTASSFAAWAGSGGPLLIELRNNPYPDPPQQVDQVIADAVSGAYALPGVRFTANPNEAWHPDWRIVYAFNVPPSMRLEPVCDPRLPLPPPSAGDWHALVVFCNEWRPISAAGAWSVPLVGPDSPDFRGFAQQAMLTLFQPEFHGRDEPNDLITRMRQP